MNGDEGNIAAIEKLYASTPMVLKWVFKPNGDLGMFTSYIQSSPDRARLYNIRGSNEYFSFRY